MRLEGSLPFAEPDAEFPAANRIMSNDKLRRRVALEAARLIFEREEPGVFQAKRMAVRRFHGPHLRLADLPSDREIREQIDSVVQLIESRSESPPLFPRISPDSLASPKTLDRFRAYETLLLPLENVKEDPRTHPEGDALYHSLQAFELAKAKLPYDEEFLLAALLHDVGKAIDPRDHVQAGLEALEGHVTPRTAWLIERCTEAACLLDGTLGARSRRRLQQHESFDELVLLAKCDRKAHASGAAVSEVSEAMQYLRDLVAFCEA